MPVTTTTTTSNSVDGAGVGRTVAGRHRPGAEGARAVAQARLVTAQARLREAEANATKTARDVERLRGLLAKDEVSQQQFDAAVAAADVQRAAVESAKSQIAEAEAGIQVAESRLMQARPASSRPGRTAHARRPAPQQVAAMRARAASAEARVAAGQGRARAGGAQPPVHRRQGAGQGHRQPQDASKPGQVVQPGQPLMALIPLDTVWITANFKETQLTRCVPARRRRSTVDAYGGREFTGHVDSIAAATGARFSLLPPENATGNFVKVVQRVPVKIVLEPGQDREHVLRPGMSVTPTVYTK